MISRRFLIVALIAAAAVAVSMYAWRRPPATALEAAVADVEAGRRTTPLVDESSVTFLAKAERGRTPRIVSDVTGWGEQTDGTFDFSVGAMARVGATPWYSLRAEVASGARVEYLIAYDLTDYRLDPHNPRKAARPTPASEFVMPDYLFPEELADPPVSPAGAVTETIIASRALQRACRALVYTPPTYRSDTVYPLCVFLDMRAAPVTRVVDWLTAHQTIQPIVVVFIETEPSGAESRTPDPLLRSFLTDELPAWAASRFRVTTSAAERAIVGISFGARDALDAALSPAQAFDNLGLLIPGRRIAPGEIDAIAERSVHQLHVAIVAGRYDEANVPTARNLRSALAHAGHDVDYTEVPEGHSSVTWINHVRAVLISLFGRK